MHVVTHFRWLFLTFLFLLNGCAVTADTVADEPVELDGQTGEAQQPVTWANQMWWKNMTQIGRNSAILTRAYQDYNAASPKYVGLVCKEWVKKVVNDASMGVVTLPTTTNNGSGWQWNSSTYVKDMGKTISSAMPGNIVQMNISVDSPHTAIVYANNGTTITWIDSNWSVDLDKKVRIHSQTIANFLAMVTFGGVQHYTVYQVTGG